MKNRYNNIFYFHIRRQRVAKITPSPLADRCSSIESHAGKTRDTYDSSDEEADFVDTATTMTPSVLERRLATMRLRRCTMSTQFNDWSHVLETSCQRTQSPKCQYRVKIGFSIAAPSLEALRTDRQSTRPPVSHVFIIGALGR